MSKVIQNINSLLHRGQKSSSDPYNNKRLNFSSARLHFKTLGTSRTNSNTRCSSTFSSSNSLSSSSSFFNSYINAQKRIRLAGFSSALSLLVLSVLFIYPIVKNLNSAEAIGQDSTTTLSMTTGMTSANVELLVKDANGTFAKSSDSDRASFTVTTNNGSGYTVTIKGKDSTYSRLTNSTTNTYLTSISSSMSESSFSSYALSSNQGIWGYQPSKLNSSTNTNYKSAPDNTTGDTIDKTAAANDSSNTYYIGLGAKANYHTPAGTYTNTFVLTAVGNGTPYSITYADSTGDTISNLPSRQYSDTGITATSVTLSSTTPTRTGYTFLKWCDGTVSNNGTSCSGTTYNAGASYGIDRQATSNNATLYAVWSPTITIKAVDGANVSLDGTSCTNTSAGCTITGLAYNTSYNLVATVTNTDKYSFTSWSKSSTASGTGTIASSTAASTTYTVGSLPITITPTLTINKYTCTKQYRLQNADGTWGSYTTDTTEQVNYGATCSYSKTVTNYKGSSSGSNNSAGTASGTMTASGLTLQVSMYRNTYTVTVSNSNTTSGASSLTIRYGGSATVTVTPNSGYYLSSVSCPTGYTCSGYSTGTSYTSQQTVTVTNNNSTNTSNTLSFTGTTAIKLYIQDVTSSTCTTTAQTVYDNRDEQSYVIQKLNDGKCWMMTNLNLGATTLTTDLTSSNTNLASTVTASTFNGWKKSSGSQIYTAAEYIPISGTDSTSGTPYGTLYNYCAASAGTICTISNSSNATYDICPKGWRLPTSSNTSGEFQALYNKYSSNAKMRAPYTSGGAAFALAGNFSYSTPANQGSYGLYWSSKRSSDTGVYILHLSTSTVNPSSLSNRDSGFSIRCVLK